MMICGNNENDYGDYIYGRAALRLLEPWIVPEALGFLKCIFGDKPDFDVFEWGVGASTIWFGKNTTGTVYSVEQGRKWMGWAKGRKTDNVKLRYRPSTVHRGAEIPCAEHYRVYADAIFDILYKDHNVRFISVDGERRVRNRCIANAIKVLEDAGNGGIIMVDNSNWPDIQDGVTFLRTWKTFDFDAPKHSAIPGGWRTSFYIMPGGDDEW